MKPIMTKNVDGLIDRLTSRSSVTWMFDPAPGEHIYFLTIEGYFGPNRRLVAGTFEDNDGFELVTEDEFVEMIARWLPKEAIE